MDGYEQVLIIWGVCWMLFGTGLMYLLHRLMSAENEQVEHAAETSEIVGPAAVAHQPTSRAA